MLNKEFNHQKFGEWKRGDKQERIRRDADYIKHLIDNLVSRHYLLSFFSWLSYSSWNLLFIIELICEIRQCCYYSLSIEKKKEESDLKALKVVVWWLGLTLDGVRYRWDVVRLAWQDVYETSPITRNQQLFRDVVMCPRHSTLGNHSYSHIFLSERSVNYGLLSE